MGMGRGGPPKPLTGLGPPDAGPPMPAAGGGGPPIPPCRHHSNSSSVGTWDRVALCIVNEHCRVVA
jgi:hypothetical protein